MKEKKERDAKERAHQMYMDSNEIGYTTNSDFMTENPDTCASVMSPYRVKKDHWKGMSPEQRQDILDTRKAQVYDKKRKDEMDKEAERLWAEQEEEKRLMLIRQTLEKQRRERDMNDALREKHIAQMNEKNAKWTNFYGEKLGFDRPIA